MGGGVSCMRPGELIVSMVVEWWVGSRARDVEKGVTRRLMNGRICQ